MKYCLQPYYPYERGAAVGRDLVSNRKPLTPVACGRCRCCVINRKQDWAGRLCAESLEAAETYFVTLTYGEEPQEFPYSDVQKMLKRLRFYMSKRAVSVRHFVVGEFGEEKGRRHWHAMLFFSRPVGLERPAEGTHWGFWPHGWTSIERIEGHGAERMRRMRYCAKYAVTAVDDVGHPPPRMSLIPAIGSRWFEKLAARMARSGVVPNGKYNLPGCVWQGGPRKGYHETFTLRGAARADFILAYLKAWERAYPDRDYPQSEWLRKYAPEGGLPLLRRGGGKLFSVKERASRHFDIERRMMIVRASEIAKAAKSQDDGSRSGVRWIVGQDWSAEVRVDKGGQAYVLLGIVPPIPIMRSVSEVLDFAPEMTQDIDAWLRKMRGPRWSDSDGKTLKWTARWGLDGPQFGEARRRRSRDAGSSAPVVGPFNGGSLGQIARNAAIARYINGPSGAVEWIGFSPSHDFGVAKQVGDRAEFPAFTSEFRAYHAEAVGRDGAGSLGFDED